MARSRDQRFKDGGMGGGAGGDIDDREAHARRAVRTAGDGGEAALRLNQQIVGLAMSVRTVIAIATDGTADQRRIILLQTLKRKTKLVHRTRLEVLDQHIRSGDQLVKALVSFLGGAVDLQRSEER